MSESKGTGKVIYFIIRTAIFSLAFYFLSTADILNSILSGLLISTTIEYAHVKNDLEKCQKKMVELVEETEKCEKETEKWCGLFVALSETIEHVEKCHKS